MTTASILPSPTGGVLVASPSTTFREQVRRSLHGDRGPIHEVQGGADALVKLESGHWQLLFLDRRLNDLDVEELMEIIKLRYPGIEVVLLDSDSTAQLPSPEAAYGSWLNPSRTVVPAVRGTAPTFGSIPSLSTQKVAQPIFSNEILRRRISSGLEAVRSHLAADDPQARTVAPLPGMIGNAEVMQKLYRLTRLVAPRMTTVMIAGATGTGKELVARAIHQLSARAAKPWAVVNCAAIPEALLESELFGHVRGAFTGAVQGYAGRIHLAQGGTLFLDEVGELPLSLQAKLLRFLDQKEVQRLGSSETLKVDVRVVAASNANLARCVDEGRFRDDLYYRLSTFPLQLPTLAERSGDVLRLAEYFLQGIAAAEGAPAVIDAQAARVLEAHAWPGNVRELQQVMERAYILAEGGQEILPEHLCFASLRGTRRAESSTQVAAACGAATR
jgi:transcriptional regulator with GAF, ATPase, and Fis domain